MRQTKHESRERIFLCHQFITVGLLLARCCLLTSLTLLLPLLLRTTTTTGTTSMRARMTSSSHFFFFFFFSSTPFEDFIQLLQARDFDDSAVTGEPGRRRERGRTQRREDDVFRLPRVFVVVVLFTLVVVVVIFVVVIFLLFLKLT